MHVIYLTDNFQHLSYKSENHFYTISMHYIIIYCEEDFERAYAFKCKLDEACPSLIGYIHHTYTESSLRAIEEALSNRLWVLFFKTPRAYLCSHFMNFHRSIIKYSWTHDIKPYISILACEVDSCLNTPVGVLHAYGTYLLYERATVNALSHQCKRLIAFSGYGRWSGYRRHCNNHKLGIALFYRELEEEEGAET